MNNTENKGNGMKNNWEEKLVNALVEARHELKLAEQKNDTNQVSEWKSAVQHVEYLMKEQSTK